MGLRKELAALYRGDDAQTRRFYIALAAFDIATIIFLVASSFFPGSPVVETIDVVVGILILFELVARVAVSRSPRREALNPFSLADIVVVISLLAPMLGEGFAFLRVLRILRLVRSYEIVRGRKPDDKLFGRRHEAIVASLNLSIFLFIMTAIVYETQRRTNADIRNYVDALYFTVTTLTTTGFGDVTLKGVWGRLLSVVIMIVGVSLFLRLVQVMIRPSKVEFECPDCGLCRHDFDAVHCKACGRVLDIRDEGGV